MSLMTSQAGSKRYNRRSRSEPKRVLTKIRNKASIPPWNKNSFGIRSRFGIRRSSERVRWRVCFQRRTCRGLHEPWKPCVQAAPTEAEHPTLRLQLQDLDTI